MSVRPQMNDPAQSDDRKQREVMWGEGLVLENQTEEEEQKLMREEET